MPKDSAEKAEVCNGPSVKSSQKGQLLYDDHN